MIGALAVAGVLLLLAYRYARGLAILRSGLRRLAAGDTNFPLMLELPRALRPAELDLRTVALRFEELERVSRGERFGLETILSGIAEGVFVVDQALRIRMSNPAAEAMAPSPGPLSARTIVEAFGNADMHHLVREAVLSGRLLSGEVTLDRSREVAVYEVAVSPLPETAESQRGAVVVMRDVSRIRNLERLRREFVANVSHELRTPLTIINGYLETLSDGGIDDRALAANALDVMSKHTDRLKRLVDDLLVISESESQSLALQAGRVDVRDLLDRVVRQLEEPIRAHEAAVRVVAGGHDLAIEADAGRLEQVFLNLVENAIKHGNRRPLAVELRATRGEEEISVEVADNGIGIPYGDQQHVFERFYRVEKHRSRETGGTGLGLAIVKNVVQAHGGRVSLESTPGQGSTFRIVLPVRPVPSAEKDRNPD
ncbi:MAG: hypothetical protein FGM15_00100 [Chthoniobacterales bacterium]|nr:hypothetical protein [Chthoniobacterales bacterium]